MYILSITNNINTDTLKKINKNVWCVKIAFICHKLSCQTGWYFSIATMAFTKWCILLTCYDGFLIILFVNVKLLNLTKLNWTFNCKILKIFWKNTQTIIHITAINRSINISKLYSRFHMTMIFPRFFLKKIQLEH